MAKKKGTSASKQYRKIAPRKRTLCDVINDERIGFNRRLATIVTALAAEKDYNRGLIPCEKLPKDPFDDRDISKLLTRKVPCCQTAAGMMDPKVEISIIPRPNPNGSLDLRTRIEATHACGIFGYYLNTFIYRYDDNLGFLFAGSPPTVTVYGLDGKLDQEFNSSIPGPASPVPPLPIYRVEVFGRVSSRCDGKTTRFAKTVVGPV